MTPPAVAGASFGDFVDRAAAAGRLVVQPRMGFSDPGRMRAGLLAVRSTPAVTAGTVTLDSYTRVGDHAAARRAVAAGLDLNGYPLVTHPADTTRAMLRDLPGPTFPVQVRHGSADPRRIVGALVDVGLHATEGGPVSYCLPYGRTPLRESVRNWADSCALLARAGDRGPEPHLETFGGCLLGQLCPPGLLVAVSVLEALFFRAYGLRSVSLSYAQQTDAEQDVAAVTALRRLAREYLPDIQWHVVVYTYMGVYPRHAAGARRLSELAARVAVRAGAARLIVKTAAEAHRIPTIGENVAALRLADEAARDEAAIVRVVGAEDPDDLVGQVYREAGNLIEATLELDDDVGRALLAAFARGHLDVPYCLHPDNAGRSASFIDERGRLRWARTGNMPIPADVPTPPPTTAASLMNALSHVERRFDADPSVPHRTRGIR
ncbi:methylaspartate mutase [Micromonospora sp. WMMD882]|uniref:methylaspartate mutase n=1 Tax=Micromonospora sp. WMMD882 TaxID=3015151 RepID=UPI00248AB080|nr:methylaspartate mutase [Micromonospora sp. WMMD882]WBB80962.1 methylaspartate mutase [Micromonospora sp. WMMD882]